MGTANFIPLSHFGLREVRRKVKVGIGVGAMDM